MVATIAVTTGEPAGIGPELLIQLCQRQHSARLVAIADPELLAARAAQLRLPLRLLPCSSDHLMPAPAGSLFITPVTLKTASTAGKLDPANSPYVITTLTQAIDGCLTGDFDAMVTAPVHKAVINDAGIPFSGHTEFLAERTGSKRVVMMLATPNLRVALVTTHLPLARVSSAINRDLLREVLQVLHHDLIHHFGLAKPRILVCGLNPHAGEGGHMGMEEIETITPVLEELRATGMHLNGPVPADTAFTRARLSSTDVVLAMYHDQGLPVLKHQGFGEAVNITLGLPIIRTSVDHGTALDLAGSGKADPGSLRAAIDYALHMVTQRVNPHGTP